jgi:hypothetical protein
MLDLKQFEGHTPGPWVQDPTEEQWVCDAVCNCIAEWKGWATTLEEDLANAKLIAAAPTLLDELKATRADLDEVAGLLRRARVFSISPFLDREIRAFLERQAAK